MIRTMKVNDFSSVKGKVAVVTGAASGIGRAIAQTFAANGMKVVIADIQDELGKKMAEEICANGGDAIYCHTDVLKEEEMIKTIETTKKTYGKLHVMVNNAGIGCEMHPVHEYDLDVFKRVNDINYIGTFIGMKYAVKAMLATDSHQCAIINIASASGLSSSGNYSLYDASKSAVIRLTNTAGLDYAKHDITVNVICPGVIMTEIYAKLSPKQLELSAGMIPMGRFGKPEEIAYMALFLASDMARFITGAVFSVDAGMTAGEYTTVDWIEPDPREL